MQSQLKLKWQARHHCDHSGDGSRPPSQLLSCLLLTGNRRYPFLGERKFSLSGCRGLGDGFLLFEPGCHERGQKFTFKAMNMYKLVWASPCSSHECRSGVGNQCLASCKSGQSYKFLWLVCEPFAIRDFMNLWSFLSLPPCAERTTEIFILRLWDTKSCWCFCLAF